MAITEQQARNIMNLSVEQIKSYIASGKITFPDDLIKYKNTPKFKAIEENLAAIPEPEAMRQWEELMTEENVIEQAHFIKRLENFIAQNASKPGNREMIEAARAKVMALTTDIEHDDWEKVNTSSVNSLLMHKRKYPSTSHAEEIENLVWALTDRSDESQVRRYLQAFPDAVHRAECDEILSSQQLWHDVSTDADLVTLNDYIVNEPSSPFADDALALLEKLKKEEIDKMRGDPSGYDVDFFKSLRTEGIFTDAELMAEGVCTEQSLKFLSNPPMLPDIEQRANSNPVVRSGATDVFLFGIPSSGKTCVLMGLLGASDFDYDNAAEGLGGAYADDLKLYRTHGKAPGRTYGNFVAQIQGRIRPAKSGITYPINLIEMSGEEFAMKIAYNAENITNFEDMGSGASKLLTSPNQKVIFIVIDPNAEGLIRISTTRADGTSEARIVQQDIVISKIVNMLRRNPQVLQRTDAIHFIMTKSDILGERDERESIAVDRIKSLYKNTIDNLREICRDFSINRSTGGDPALFTFSLGNFYVGDMFEYDPTDAEIIISNLTKMCQGDKRRGFFHKIQKSVN